MGPHGFFRLATASPRTFVAAPERNVDRILGLLDKAADCDCVVFPELCLTGYTCGDLFANESLLAAATQALRRLAEASKTHPALVIVGLPLAIEGSLYNVAAIVQGGVILGIVPKTFLPNYREFYERRWFRPAHPDLPATIDVAGQTCRLGTDLLFTAQQAVVGVEICEDLWTPIAPSCHQAIAGANVLVNLSASNETVGKSQWRRDLVVSQSGRCIAAYAYASAGPGESTSDLVFGGHCLIAENGTILEQGQIVGSLAGEAEIADPEAELLIRADIDLQRLAHDRRVQNSFAESQVPAAPSFRKVAFEVTPAATEDKSASRRRLLRKIDPFPFVPGEASDLRARCAEIFAIQVAGLAKRVSRLPSGLPLVIGISGGLDSTLALLVAVKLCDSHHWDRRRILGVTMPGFGTSVSTRTNAIELMNQLRIGQRTVDIRQLSLDTFRALEHRPLGITVDAATTVDSLQRALRDVELGDGDLVFENVQARARTMVLMNLGFVLGTGDLSEQALGWSTYNGDHMSMYNVNGSVPKTLVRFLVRYAADNYFDQPLRDILHRIADTPISPELLPLSDTGEIQQHTESRLGPYELHDFFLYHFVRYGSSPEKILMLAEQATFSQAYTTNRIAQVLDIFLQRFVSQQFKRNCVPDGPKVGSVSLSPRGDWRMPSDAESDLFDPR
jgi:NAD+ synthase (glutamine-hydrolysing)